MSKNQPRIRFSKSRFINLSFWLLLLVVQAVNGQEVDINVSIIEWDEGRKLTWDDYEQRKYSFNRGKLAVTSVKHSVIGKIKGDLPYFEVKVYFIAQDSWTTNKSDSRLLAHEQLHFDIGELFRRRIEERIEKLRKQGEKQKAIYSYVIKDELYEFRQYSKKYDKATRHGVLLDEQAKWEKQVWDELKRLH